MESIQYFQNYLHHQRDSLGVVSRYVLDMFGFMQAKLSFTQESQVPLRIGFDVCAFEIYNETTKDLVAASMSGTSTVGERKPPLPRRASRTGSLCSSRNSNASNDMWAKKEESTVRLTTFVSKSFDYFQKTAAVEGRASDTPAVVQLKNTERRQLLRKMRRIRTTTLVETIAALQELLFARQCSATEHNAFSSRSHLCINFECFTFSTKENESTRVASPRDELTMASATPMKTT
ncbi:hypothetical protein AGDE_13842 [Angomonas deanei]|uniref:Kinesin motor domain containing protein n=1 Tax=Angomonas deanei TaxID=59799 RepID=A0A7G2CQR2_9TRYP|nr:hypothetical protein AGDE_13842 [Angomonas deanei]CAD2220522.1 hypothetical protein, conserved [Angomonas deanei]|eukprot:EPY21711.1 hypothetical protein AGDE_13842 [Angomonas deanei]